MSLTSLLLLYNNDNEKESGVNMIEKYLVIANKDFDNETIHYCGDVELDAFKKFNKVQFKMKQIVRANVDMVKLHGVDFIKDYKIIEKIKG